MLLPAVADLVWRATVECFAGRMDVEMEGGEKTQKELDEEIKRKKERQVEVSNSNQTILFPFVTKNTQTISNKLSQVMSPTLYVIFTAEISVILVSL